MHRFRFGVQLARAHSGAAWRALVRRVESLRVGTVVAALAGT